MVKQKNKEKNGLYDFEYAMSRENNNDKKKADSAKSASKHDKKSKKEAEKKLNKKNEKEIKNIQKKKEKQNKSRKNIRKPSKKIDKDNEIIIGVTRIPEEHNKENKQFNSSNNKKRASIKKDLVKTKPKSIEKVEKKESLSQRLKREKRKRKITRVTKIFILVSITIIAIIYTMMSPIFNITNINICGNNKIFNEEILSISQISVGDNIFKISEIAIEKRLKENAYVNTVKIVRKLPNAVEIQIEERVATLMLLYGNGYVYINNQGYMLEITNTKKELPILIGISTTNDKFKEGNRLDDADLNKLGTVLKIMNAAELNGILSIITSIDISNPSNYTLYFEKEKKTAYLGDCTNLETRMLYLNKIIEEESGIEGEIFVNMNLNTENSFFRESV